MKVLDLEKNELINEIYPTKMIYEIEEPLLGSKDTFQAIISIELISKFTKATTKKNLEDIFNEILKVFD